jgi:hypothetical protein
LLRDPHYNKGLAFTERERETHYLRGLLPPAIVALMDLQERNEWLFYKLLIDNVEELLPIMYTPTVGEAYQKYGSIFSKPQGLYISLKEKGKILEVLKNRPERSIQVIVVTDGERILGLGDPRCQGMGIPVGKLSIYTALGEVRPSACLPITLDVGTNNEELINDKLYIGLRQRRATGQEFTNFLQEFMTAVKHNAGYKHKEQQTQGVIDQIIKEHLGQVAAFQAGAQFNQHLLLAFLGAVGCGPPSLSNSASSWHVFQCCLHIHLYQHCLHIEIYWPNQSSKYLQKHKVSSSRILDNLRRLHLVVIML